MKNGMKDKILAAAMQLANLKGYKNVTRDDIASRADVAAGSVSYHFGDMRKLQAAMVERAVLTQNLKVVAQAMADRHPVALKAPEDLRKRAALLLAA